MMECMRPELEPRGVICSAFCPGAVQSNIAEAGKTRPADLAETGYAEADKRRRRRQLHAPLPDQGGGRATRAAGILNDELYILTHSEFLVGARTRRGDHGGGADPLAGKPEYKATFAMLFRNPAITAEIERQKLRAGADQAAPAAEHAHHISGRGPASRKPEHMKDFAGRTAFVTGGANGVGIGLVRQLLNEGCKVAIADIRQDSIDKALAALDNREVMGVQLDVASREGFREAADRVEAEWGRFRSCSTTPGEPFQPIEESSFDDWDWLLGVNLHGVINGVMTFVPRMVERVKAGEQKGGHVVNTASMAAFLAAGTPGIYNTTKFAVRGLSESLHYSLLQYGSACRCSARAW
jgi:NAD(P)-dependent dehydrogenase (short-subunit alcohol dehydrogenase family)